jgi:hypothetical protein
MTYRWLLFIVSWGLIAVGATIEQPAIRGFCERTVPLSMLFLTALTTAGCGGRLLQYYSGPSARPLEFLSLSSALGWAVLSLGLSLLAACGQFFPLIFVPLAVACSALFGIGMDGHLSGWRIWGSIRWRLLWGIVQRRITTVITSFVTFAVILVTFLWASGPVWDYDSEMYHLPNSASLLAQHGLVVDAATPLANLPGQAYLWFALGLAARAEAYPALLVCWASVLTSVLAACLASRWIGVRTAIWTVPVYWSALIVHAVASTPRIEQLYSLLFLASVSWLLEAKQRQNLSWPTVVYCGICLGTSASIKSQGLYGWPVIGVWWAWLWIRQQKLRTTGTLVRLTCLFLIGFSVLAPWWIKNYRAFGNPVHPMFSRILDRDSVRNANPYGPTNQTRPWYFWGRDTVDLFVKPNSFSGPPGQWPHYLFLLLPLLPVVCSRKSRINIDGRPANGVDLRVPEHVSHRRPFPTVSTVLGLALGYYLISLTLTHELRHQFGMFSLASILVAHVIAQCELRWKIDVLLPVVLCGLQLLVLFYPARATRFPKLMQYLLGFIDRAALREAIVPANFPRTCHWCNENLPPDACVLLCWESRVYRLERKAIADPGACNWKTLFRHRTSPAAISAYLRQQAVDYVLVNESSLVYNVEKSKLIPLSTYEEFRQQRELLIPSVLVPVYEFRSKKSATISVYRVR